MINTTILSYKLETVIGEGGMGTVYLGNHMKLDRKVAIKVLLPEFANNTQIRDRFINEAKTLSKLNQQNIVTLYDFADQDNNLYLIMEYVEGTPLDNVIEKVTGPIPEVRCSAIFEQILSGFAYAHKKGIVHRDIKPSNIILQSDDTPKILDFGIAKIVEGDLRLTKTGTRMGSVIYMSPEQVMGKEVDLRSDIYSLGVTLFEMLSGKLPYDSGTESEFEIQTKIVREPLPSIKAYMPNISDKLDQIICRATAKEPEYRFQSCEEFKDAISGSFSRVSVPSSMKTVIESPVSRTVIQNYGPAPVYQQQPKKKNMSMPVIGGIIFFVLAIVVVLYMVLQNNEPVVDTGPTITKDKSSSTGQTPPSTLPETKPTSAAVDVVRNFVEDLGNGNFRDAYNRQQNKSWGSFDHFSSTKSFGGINRTSVEDISLNYESGDDASVYVDYFAYDPVNKDGRYKQDFILKKFYGEWKIIKVNNKEIKQW